MVAFQAGLSPAENCKLLRSQLAMLAREGRRRYLGSIPLDRSSLQNSL